MSDKKPMVLVFAGPNGSGKSTITEYFDVVGTYTNADAMVSATGMSNEKAALLADQMRYDSIEAKADYTEDKIRSRYEKSLGNIKKLMRLCDILHVYDNTEEPVRIIRKHKEDISIYPNDFWPQERILQLL